MAPLVPPYSMEHAAERPTKPTNENGRKNVKAEMSYGEYKRRQEQEMGLASGGDSLNSAAEHQSSSRKLLKDDDGWSDDESAAAQRSSGSSHRGSRGGGPSRYNQRPAARQEPMSDGWDVEPPKASKSAAQPPIPDSVWDKFKTPSASALQQNAKKASDDWDNGDNSEVKVVKAAAVADWDESELAGSAKPIQVAAKKNDDWSDEETSHQSQSHSFSPKKERSFKPNYSDGRSRSRESSHNSSDGRNFSRDRSNSYRGRGGYNRDSNTREDSRDRSSGKPFEKRQPRDGDWDCSKCKCNNFNFRKECYRCHEPKGEDAGKVSSGHQDRESSRGGFRGRGGSFRGNESRGSYQRRGDGGGYRGRNDSNSWRGGRNNATTGKPVSSGWSENEEDSTKPKKPKTDDGWDDDDKPKDKVAKAPKVDDTDDWDKGNSISPKPSKRKLEDEDFTAPALKKQATADVWEFLNKNVDQNSNDLMDSVNVPNAESGEASQDTNKTREALTAPDVDDWDVAPDVQREQNEKTQNEPSTQQEGTGDVSSEFSKPYLATASDTATNCDNLTSKPVSGASEEPKDNDDWED